VLPAPAPYREGLLAALHAHPELELRVIYATAEQPSWDHGPGWFPHTHPYPALHLRALQRARPGRTPVQWPRGLGRALRRADADCVVASEYGLASLRSLAWCRRHGRAHVVLTECTAEINPLLSPGQLALHRWLARHTDHVIAVSAAGRERLRGFGVPEERITVSTQPAVLDPVRAAAVVAAAERAADGTGEPPLVVVLAAGRLVPDKNLATLIQAIARLDRSGERVRLEIAGTGFLEPSLRALAASLGVPVGFLGAVPPASMAERYARAHVFALVSTFEPFGVVVREAVAAGLPILCSRRAGAAGEVALAARNALLVDPESLEEVTDGLRRLVEDGALRARMAAESRAIDGALEGRDVAAFAAAIETAAARRGR
jgi:glycosyltransferase involved in cell wall biosynthesis